MAKPAVRFFVPDHPRLAITLAQRIGERAEKLAAEIASGHCQDWADYKYRCGRLKALREDIQECEDTEKEMNS